MTSGEGQPKKRPVAPPHKHIWGQWYPYDKMNKWRQCVVPNCYEKEVEKAL